ncbi:hypothetical protein [Methylobacterium gossipiicola]|uniref:Uncharacterized protein n=1 Tax=Methylobacterium gossipiicola TaxID=582675 RepID=A0A1I2R8C9_9HYPH|nr:hypothetical protein [Methylobacterium gossipiicola]SFG36778.1 hypothetical protein SAMN05192565_102148 [Methylobacterium gossipiicola]
MNIALFALAVLMIVGGVAAVIQGFPFVRLESGMAMTVAGATSASAGAVLLGLAVVAQQLRSLTQRLASTELAPSREIAPSREAAPARPFAPDLSGPTVADPEPDERPGRQRPSLDGLATRDTKASHGLAGLGAGFEAEFAAGLAGATFAASAANDAPQGAGPSGRGTEPTFIQPPEPAAAEVAEPRLEEPAHEPLLAEVSREPSPLPEPFPQTSPELLPPPVRTVAVEPPPSEPVVHAPPVPEMDTLAQDDHPKPRVFDVEAAGEPLRLYPTLDTTDLTPLPSPAPAPEPEPVAIEDQPDVVGTYKSGGNTYVMFSNGSIQAETPRGRFTFASLDELKDFVRAGGEGDTRGAA